LDCFCVFAKTWRFCSAVIACNIAGLIPALLTADDNTRSIVRQWTDSVARFEQGAGADMTTVRAMFGSLESLEKVGVISQTQAAEIRRNCQSLAKRALSDEIVHDVTLMAAKLEQTSSRLVASKRPQLNAERAVELSGMNATEQVAASLTRTFAALGSKLQSFNDAVSQYVLTSGETAATMRWQRATDRFERMRGISDDVDRVLLRDVVESASALGEAEKTERGRRVFGRFRGRRRSVSNRRRRRH